MSAAGNDELVSAEVLAKLRAIALATIGDLVDLETPADELRILAISRASTCSISTARAALDSIAAGARGTVLETAALGLLGEILKATR